MRVVLKAVQVFQRGVAPARNSANLWTSYSIAPGTGKCSPAPPQIGMNSSRSNSRRDPDRLVRRTPFSWSSQRRVAMRMLEVRRTERNVRVSGVLSPSSTSSSVPASASGEMNSDQPVKVRRSQPGKIFRNSRKARIVLSTEVSRAALSWGACNAHLGLGLPVEALELAIRRVQLQRSNARNSNCPRVALLGCKAPGVVQAKALEGRSSN